MRLTKILVIVAVICCLSIMLSSPVSATPQKKVEYSIYGFSIGGGTGDFIEKDNVFAVRTITPATNLIIVTLDGTMYYGIVTCYTDSNFNLNAWCGSMLTHWEMQLYEQTWFTPNDPCVGTLRGITILYLTDMDAAFLPTGSGVQQGSDGTGVMEGVTIHGYEELYPTTVTLPPVGTFTTLGFTVQGTAII